MTTCKFGRACHPAIIVVAPAISVALRRVAKEEQEPEVVDKTPFRRVEAGWHEDCLSIIVSAKCLRLARLIEIIHIVSADPTWSATKLADYFEISKKRIYDDLRELNAANIPIVFDSDFGGYTLLRKTRIPTGSILNNMRLLQASA